MKGDFSRNSFQPLKNFSRVLQQQGRVQLDADWNEQVSILLHQMRMIAVDCFGAYGGPDAAVGGGFALSETTPASAVDFVIGNGRYYVGGVLVENTGGEAGAPYTFQKQPFWTPPAPLAGDAKYLLYLDVWERLVTALEAPELREIALGGPDTAARAQVVWQLKAATITPGVAEPGADRAVRASTKPAKPGDSPAAAAPAAPAAAAARARIASDFPTWESVITSLQQPNRGALRASVDEPEPETLPCTLPPTSKYRGENQLWRVEVHRGGTIAADGADGTEKQPTFKVSSDNGSIVYEVIEVELAAPVAGAEAGLRHYSVKLTSLGRDSRTAIAEGDWVELVDERYALESASDDLAPDPLFKVVAINADDVVVTLQGRVSEVAARFGVEKGHVLLRRWDQQAVIGENPIDNQVSAYGTFAIGAQDIKLQSGIRLTFSPMGAGQKPQLYRRGDYWLIPAREAIGDIEWPRTEDGEELFLPPRGIKHQYAPIAVIARAANGQSWTFEQKLMPATPFSVDVSVPEY